MELPFFKLIREGTKAVPAVKFAVGVSAISAIVGLIASFELDLRITLWGTFVILILMFFLLLFARLAKTTQSEFKYVLRVLMWAFVLLFICISTMLTSSIFFKWPVNLQYIISDTPNNVSTKVEERTLTNIRVYKHVVALDYMRLFGANAVPLFMHVFESRDSLIQMRDGGEYKNTFYYVGDYHTKGKNDYMSKELIDFWKNEWEYNKALPLKTDLWTRFSGNWLGCRELFYTSLSPSFKDYSAFINENQFIMGFDEEELDSLDKVFQPSEENMPASTDIGFLFVIITNNSDVDIYDVVFQYEFFKNSLKMESLLHKSGKYHDDMSFKKASQKPTPRSIALSEDSIRLLKPDNRAINLASLKAKKSVIWLLSIYRKKKNGLPDFYLTDVNVPVRCEFSIDGHPYYDSLRQPYGEKAGRINIPDGWYSQ